MEVDCGFLKSTIGLRVIPTPPALEDGTLLRPTSWQEKLVPFDGLDFAVLTELDGGRNKGMVLVRGEITAPE
jgi:hypothetical protein